MIGYLDLSGQILGAGDLIREHRRQQVFGIHARDLRRDFLAAAKTRQRKRNAGVPAPAYLEHRRRAQCLHEQLTYRIRVQIPRGLRQLETMRMSQRQHNVILGRGRLKFEIECTAEPLAQGQSPRAIYAAAKWGMNHQLHAAGFIEKTLEDDGIERGQAAERGAARAEVLNQFNSRRLSESDRLDQPPHGGAACQSLLDFLSEPRYGRRQLQGAARRLTQPKRNGRWLASRILDAHRAPLDPQYSIRRVSQLEHIALQALDGKVFIDGADQKTLRLQHHPVIGIVRNRAAGRERREARALAGTQDVVDRVAMQKGPPAPAAGAEPLRQHAHALVEFFAPQTPVGIRSAHEIEQFILGPFARRDFGGDLLSEDIQRVFRNAQAIQFAAANGIEQRRALHQFVSRQRKQSTLGSAAHGVPGPADALQKGVDGSR